MQRIQLRMQPLIWRLLACPWRPMKALKEALMRHITDLCCWQSAMRAATPPVTTMMCDCTMMPMPQPAHSLQPSQPPALHSQQMLPAQSMLLARDMTLKASGMQAAASAAAAKQCRRLLAAWKVSQTTALPAPPRRAPWALAHGGPSARCAALLHLPGWLRICICICIAETVSRNLDVGI